MIRDIKCPDCKGEGYRMQGHTYIASDGEIDTDVEKEFCDRCGGSGMIIADDRFVSPVKEDTSIDEEIPF